MAPGARPRGRGGRARRRRGRAAGRRRRGARRAGGRRGALERAGRPTARRLRLRAHLARHVDVADVVAVARREPPPEDVRLVVAAGAASRFDRRPRVRSRARGGRRARGRGRHQRRGGRRRLERGPGVPGGDPRRRLFALASLRAATDAAAVGGDAPRRARVAAALARGDAVGTSRRGRGAAGRPARA